MSFSLIFTSFANNMDKLGPFNKKPHLAIALSGGQDSLSLAYLSKKWIKIKNGLLTVLIVNHNTRIETDKESSLAASWTKDWNINTKILKIKENNIFKDKKQEILRKNRYNIIIKECKKNNIPYLLTGHHLEDQAETQVIRFLKGSNIEGLQGMIKNIQYSNIKLIRPMINIKKNEISSVLPIKQRWIEDPSNKSNKYFRNRLRFFLKKENSINLKHINKSSIKLKKINDFLNYQIKIFFKASINTYIYGYAIISLIIKKLNFIILEKILSKIIKKYSGSIYPPGYNKIINLIKYILKNKFKGLTCGGCIIKPYKKNIIILREYSLINNISLTKEKKIIWDNRFVISGLSLFKKNTTIEALGKQGVQEIKMKSINFNSLKCPYHVKLSLPCMRFKNTLIGIPHIGHIFKGKINFKTSYFN